MLHSHCILSTQPIASLRLRALARMGPASGQQARCELVEREAMDWQPASDWAHLPAELLQHAARLAAGEDSALLGRLKATLRLVAMAWHAALPLGK